MDFTTIERSLQSVSSLINMLIPIVISIALLLFLIGIVQYVTAGGDEEKRAAARGMIIFGIIALFVMVSVWGFVNILAKSFFNGQVTSVPVYTPHAIPPGGSGGGVQGGVQGVGSGLGGY
ncbi:MAG: hypothetical protein V4438_04490 [Patescibacteria group bacterium]